MKTRVKKTAKSPAPSRRAAVKRGPAAEDQVRWLLHELQVHSEEITVQNEHLVRAQAEVEQARDRYAELYDFAPVGYLSLDLHGAIHECNFAASALLSRSRRFLLNVPLSALLITEHRPILREYLQQIVRQDDASAIEVQIKVAPKRIVRLFAKPRPSGVGSQMLFTAMMDVTVERQLENERREVLAREQSRARELVIQVEDRTRAETRVKALLDRLVTVQEEERRRLSRELHDEFGQQLTALRLTLSMLKEVAGNDATHKQLKIAEGIATRLDHDVDHLARALRPAALDEFGLLPALDTFVRRWAEYHRIPASLEASAIDRLPLEVENHLYRIVQEALNNVVKHSQATTAKVSLDQSAHHVRLSVHDNGHGFDPATRAHAGMGFLGMRERVALIGGDITVDSHTGRGTTIAVRVPLSLRPS
ncbi:MAG TPA: ATP-binding protein [Vicinamibacterales bacterium]|nr:ATP-binding protein [Vicinamibacterales bacterium]